MNHYFQGLLEKSVATLMTPCSLCMSLKAAWQDSLPLPSEDSITHCLLYNRGRKHSKGIYKKTKQHQKNSVLLKAKSS